MSRNDLAERYAGLLNVDPEAVSIISFYPLVIEVARTAAEQQERQVRLNFALEDLEALQAAVNIVLEGNGELPKDQAKSLRRAVKIARKVGDVVYREMRRGA